MNKQVTNAGHVATATEMTERNETAAMRTIGIRVAPKRVTFVIFDASAGEILDVERINVPQALDTPERLKFIRNTILDIIRQYNVRRAGIRITESTAQKFSVERIELEGVLQEAFASSEVEKYFCGQISSISSRLGIDRANFKPYVEGTVVYPGIEDWGSHDKEEREAILTAIGAAND